MSPGPHSPDGRLLEVSTSELEPEALAQLSGRVLRRFDHRTQDSGNVSWLVESAGRAYFLKSAGLTGDQPNGAPEPWLDHAGRVAVLRQAVEFATSCQHPALPRLLNVVETPTGPLLVYRAAPGELIGVLHDQRTDPDSSYRRFSRHPAHRMLRVFDVLVDLHAALAAAGWVAVDLYDGCLILDFTDDRLSVVDLDHYHRGPFTNTVGRMIGSTRFMAPEEFVLGATVDQRTTVFTLGRLIWHFGTRLTEDPDRFCGSPALSALVETATRADPADRPADVATFAAEWARLR